MPMNHTSSSQWVEVARVEEIEDSDVKACAIAGVPVAVFKVKGSHYALSDICTHAHAHLSDGYIEGDTVECPLHQGRFHIPTGKALSSPATVNLCTYPVRVESGKVLVRLDRKEEA
jgi:nitrite reductase/ring-hydroxylating ferredoxin subunit